jgi:hypothetical protein
VRRLLLTGLLAFSGSICFLPGPVAQQRFVFTAEQAAAGKIEIEKNAFGACTDCHATALTGRSGDSRELPPLASLSEDYQKLIKGNGGIVPPFVGADFLAKWGPRTTQHLIKEFDDRFRSLTLDTRLNLIAYILQRNGAQPAAATHRRNRRDDRTARAGATAVQRRRRVRSSRSGETAKRPRSEVASVLRRRRFNVIDHDHFLVALLRLEPQAKLLLDRFEDGVAAVRV